MALSIEAIQDQACMKDLVHKILASVVLMNDVVVAESIFIPIAIYVATNNHLGETYLMKHLRTDNKGVIKVIETPKEAIN